VLGQELVTVPDLAKAQGLVVVPMKEEKALEQGKAKAGKGLARELAKGKERQKKSQDWVHSIPKWTSRPARTLPNSRSSIQNLPRNGATIISAEKPTTKNSPAASMKRARSRPTFEALGGQEGLDGLQGEVDDYRNEIKQFSEGDPALLTQLHEANPDSFVLAISNGIDLLANKSPELFDKAILPAMVARLEKAQMYSSVQELAALIKDGKGQEAYDLTAKIADGSTRPREWPQSKSS